MGEHLILRLDGPLQSWGDVAMDPRRPTRAFPSRSAVAGLLASALGWRYRDAERTTALQDGLQYAVREDRQPAVIRDYQTADLGAIGTRGWTRWGVETREGSAREGTQILEKFYLANGCFQLALALPNNSVSLPDRGPLSLDELEHGLRRPARPVFLGRKGCPPACPLLGEPGASRGIAANPADALLALPLAPAERMTMAHASQRVLRLWYDPLDGTPHGFSEPHETQEVWDRRDFVSNRFGGSRRIALLLVPVDHLPATPPEAA